MLAPGDSLLWQNYLPHPCAWDELFQRDREPHELLDNGRMWDEVVFARDTRNSRKGEVTWKLESDAVVYGFAVWWVAELVPGITLSTAPDAPHTHWEQLYFPLLSPIAAKQGESVMVSLRSRSCPTPTPTCPPLL